MKVAIVFLTIVAVALAAPPNKYTSDPNSVAILKAHNDINANSYNFGFEQSDGTKRDEAGENKNLGEAEGIVMRGFYEYVGPDGNTYRVDYVADQNGFQPTGAHLVGVSGK